MTRAARRHAQAMAVVDAAAELADVAAGRNAIELLEVFGRIHHGLPPAEDDPAILGGLLDLVRAALAMEVER